eukprot:3139845-Amphidinium_carterae.1
MSFWLCFGCVAKQHRLSDVQTQQLWGAYKRGRLEWVLSPVAPCVHEESWLCYLAIRGRRLLLPRRRPCIQVDCKLLYLNRRTFTLLLGPMEECSGDALQTTQGGMHYV